MPEDTVVLKYFFIPMAVDSSAFLEFLQAIELYNICLQLSKNTAWLFMTMSRDSKHRSLQLFLIGPYTQARNITEIPAQQLIQEWRMQTQLSVTSL